MVRRHREGMRKLPIPQHLHPVLHGLDETSLEQQKGRHGCPGLNAIQIPHIDDRVLFSKGIAKTALGQATAERHLAPLKPRGNARARPGLLPLVPPARGLPVPRPWSATDPLAPFARPRGRLKPVKPHRAPHASHPLPHVSLPLSGPEAGRPHRASEDPESRPWWPSPHCADCCSRETSLARSGHRPPRRSPVRRPPPRSRSPLPPASSRPAPPHTSRGSDGGWSFHVAAP